MTGGYLSPAEEPIKYLSVVPFTRVGDFNICCPVNGLGMTIGDANCIYNEDRQEKAVIMLMEWLHKRPLISGLWTPAELAWKHVPRPIRLYIYERALYRNAMCLVRMPFHEWKQMELLRRDATRDMKQKKRILTDSEAEELMENAVFF